MAAHRKYATPEDAEQAARARAAAKYQANKEEIKAKRRAYYEANKPKVLAAQKEYARNKPRKPRTPRCRPEPKANQQRASSKYMRRKVSGWTHDAFEAAWLSQQGRCAICDLDLLPTGLKYNSVCADHCHESNKPRELLCRRCNAGLGHFQDRTERLLRAVAYLNKHTNTNRTRFILDQNAIDALFSGMAAKPLTGKGNYLPAGYSGTVVFKAFKWQPAAYNGKSAVFEYALKTSNLESAPPGSTFGWVIKLDGNDYAGSDIKQVMMAIGGVDPATVRAFEIDPKPHNEALEAFKEAIKDPALVVGAEAFLQTVPYKTKGKADGSKPSREIALHKWGPAPVATQAAA